MKKLSIPFSSRSFFALEHFNHNKKNILLCCPDEESAISSFKQIKFYSENKLGDRLLHFPSFDTVPYDRVSPSSYILAKRAYCLTTLASSGEPKIIVTAAQNLIQKIPQKSEFTNSTLSLAIGDQIDIEKITLFLVKNGYSRVASAVENSEFAIRGEILDLVTHSNRGYRINFGWNQVESIREYDPFSQISSKQLDNISIMGTTEVPLNSDTTLTFKNNFLRHFGVNRINHPLYESIINGQKFHGYEQLAPLFFNNMCTIRDYLSDHEIIFDNLCIQSIQEFENAFNDFYQSRLETNKNSPESFYFALSTEKYIESYDETKKYLDNNNSIIIEGGNSSEYSSIVNISSSAKIENKTEFDKLFEILTENRKKIALILCNSKGGRYRIESVAKSRDIEISEIKNLKDAKKNQINIALAPLLKGFCTTKYIFISENDIFGNKFASSEHKIAKNRLKNILTELDNITEGELVVHKEHGIGLYEKIQTIFVSNIPHDCLKIIYANNDILYLPVENIDLIKKYGGDDTQLDRLGSLNWQKRKSKLKNRIRAIAADLIKISAKRHLAKVNPIHVTNELYEKFCKKFPFHETNDQITAIEEIKSDLSEGKLIDRLICGDVGFGKTEIAMRAAFFVCCAEDQPRKQQVAVIAPTTILARQHHRNFTERFSDTNIKIAQISRLVKSSEIKKTKEELEMGEVDIIIGTHALLANDIKFHNLGMIVIDEEQHFGVLQKEKLKKLKSNVHILSLSATPIPRTLQMSMIGIKDLSLISTPPIDRLPVKTSVLPFDPVVIRDALMRERFRGGLSFYVAPRIKDIDWISNQLLAIVPELKFKIAHGQMSAAEIDKTMNEFCDGKFDILLSTTIVESGIDISIANTIIIHRADMLGLSQLYQLRGRVGRGKVRGYAYLTLSHKITTKHSLQRLDILQNIDSLGAGFTIASHDMDLRGFGNLVGDEQSGHIKEVGAELYNEMLDQAIKELKNEITHQEQITPSINLNVPILIPETYIEDSSLRLAIYRRTGNLKGKQEIEHFRSEMEDRFGSLPVEFENLLSMVKIRNFCTKLHIESIDTGPNGFVFKLTEHEKVNQMVIGFINHHPRHAKIKPDNKLVFIKKIDQPNVINETLELLQELKKLYPIDEQYLSQ